MNDTSTVPIVGAEGLGDPRLEIAWEALMQASHDALADVRAGLERGESMDSREWFALLRIHQAILRLRDQYRQRAMHLPDLPIRPLDPPDAAEN